MRNRGGKLIKSFGNLIKHNINTHIADNDFLINKDLKKPSCKLINKFGTLLTTDSQNKDSIKGIDNEKELKYPSCKLVKKLIMNIKNHQNE